MYDRRSFWERLRDFLIVLVLSLVILGVSFGAAVGAIWLGAPVWLVVIAALATMVLSCVVVALFAPRTADRVFDALVRGVGDAWGSR